MDLATVGMAQAQAHACCPLVRVCITFGAPAGLGPTEEALAAGAAVTVTGRSAHWERAFREGSFARPGSQKPAWAAFGAGFKQKAACLSACCQRHPA